MGGGDGGLAMVTTKFEPLHSNGALRSNARASAPALPSPEAATDSQFPAGLRVLVVDDDPTCLRILQTLLRRCLYEVTTCGQATEALSMLRENKDKFDLVISDVCMPDMDGFKLLELVGLEMDLPVIMMSANGETSAVMKGITHGACDYLLKPVRLEELKNIWQHVVRKKRQETHENRNYCADQDRYMRGADENDHPSPSNDAADGSGSRKRKEVKEEDDENDQEGDDPSSTKKPRVVWSVELHQQFVNAVNQLGIDKAVPKRILELMNVQGLTRENVASHLQKYRLYLKRLSGVPGQQVGMNLAFGGIRDSSFGPHTTLDGFGDLRALVAAGQLSPQALASLQAGTLSRLNMSNNMRMASLNSSGMPLMPLQGIGGSDLLGRSQITSQSLANQAGLLSGLPSGLEMEQLSQARQIAPTGQLSTLTDDVAQLNALQQQLAAATGLGTSGHARVIHGSLPPNPSSNSFRMQLLQQQQQSQNRGLVSLPPAFPRENFVSSEISFEHANRLPGAGSLNGDLGGGIGLPSLGTGSGILAGVNTGLVPSTKNFAGCLTRAPMLDCKTSSIDAATHCGMAASGTVGASASSVLVGPSVNYQAMKDSTPRTERISLTGMNDHKDSMHERSLAMDSHRPGNLDFGFKQGLNQNVRQGWQVDQGSSLIRSARLGEGSGGHFFSVGLGMNAIESQVMRNQKMNLSVRFPADHRGAIMPFSGTVCDSEQSTAESALKLKEQLLPDPVSSLKIDGGLASEHGSSADELLNILFRQHQDGAGFGESDLTTDGYSLQNLYVK